MAHRKSHKKTTRRRHRRVGAMALSAKSPLGKVWICCSWLFDGRQNKCMVDKVTGTMDAKIVAGSR